MSDFGASGEVASRRSRYGEGKSACICFCKEGSRCLTIGYCALVAISTRETRGAVGEGMHFRVEIVTRSRSSRSRELGRECGQKCSGRTGIARET